MIVLLLVKPGSLRDGLNALLYTIPDVQLVVHARDASAALEYCHKNPSILTIVEVKPGDRAQLLAQVPEMKALSPQMRVMALIHDEDDREAAEKVGIDSILEVGMRAPELKVRIEDRIHNISIIETNDQERWLG